MTPIDQWRSRAESADAVVSRIVSGMNVFVHGAAATPTTLLSPAGASQPVARFVSSRTAIVA